MVFCSEKEKIQPLSLFQIEERLQVLCREQEKSWKETRALVYSVYTGKLFEPDFLNLTSWARSKFPDREHHFLGELAAARIENYLGIEVGTLSYFNWRSLFKVNPWRSGPWDKTKREGASNYCRVRTMVFDEKIAGRLRALWEETVRVGWERGRDFPISDDLQEASARLHEKSPDLFSPPATRSGSEKWKMQALRLEKERQKLQSQNRELERRIAYLESETFRVSSSQESISSLQESVRRFYLAWQSGKIQSPVRALEMLCHAICPEQDFYVEWERDKIHSPALALKMVAHAICPDLRSKFK